MSNRKPPIKLKGVPEKPSEKKRQRRARILAQLPGTQLRIHRRTMIGQSTISRWLKDLVAAGDAHIGGWSRSRSGGPITAVYHAGPGDEAPCSIKPMTKAELHQRYQESKRKAAALEQLDIEHSAAWVQDFKPSRDHMTAAFFGGVTPN